MTQKEAIKILKRHNLWRRGANKIEETDPKLLGLAIDKAIEVMSSSDVRSNKSSSKNGLKDKDITPYSEWAKKLRDL